VDGLIKQDKKCRTITTLKELCVFTLKT
jgi:hypothetical protein